MNNFRELNQINKVFSPSAPINDRKRFVGRSTEIEEVGRGLLAKGRQIVLYGERGIGKTSLINVVTDKIRDISDKKIIKYTCSKYDSLENIIHYYLSESGQLSKKQLTEVTDERIFDAKASAGFAKGSVTSKHKEKHSLDDIIPLSINPNILTDKFFQKNIILVIDEFDNLECEKTKKIIADIIKLSSDKNTETKLIICGVAKNVLELIGYHDSNSRSLKSIKIGRMTDEELQHIISNGFNFLNINYSDNLIKLLVKLANGAPYFAHLFGEELAVYSINNSITAIKTEHFFNIITKAINSVLDTVKHNFERATQYHELEEIDFNFDSLLPTPRDVRVLVLLTISFATTKIEAVNLYYKLSQASRAVLQLKHESLSYDEIEQVVKEICDHYYPLGIYHDNKRIYFNDPFLRSYCWLLAGNLLDKDSFLKLVRDYKSPKFST